MYIKSFHIEGFGPLSNVHVEDIPCAMTVFLGNNEAGKSSAMEFMRAMLMGVPAKRNFFTQSIRNSKGGSMKIHDNYRGELDIIRHFSQNLGQVQILDALGNTLKSDILGDIFSGMSRDVYRMIYGFNLLELQNISSFHGSEVFNTILGASFGLGLQGPVMALEKIQERMDELYKARGKNTQLQKLFDAWTNNKDEIDQALEEVKQYDLFKDKQTALEDKLSSLRAEKTDVVRHGNEVQRFIGMWSQWNKWAQLQACIKQLPVASVSFPESAELVLERILEQEKIKHKNLMDLEQKQGELIHRQDSIVIHTNLLDQENILQKMHEQKAMYKQAVTDNMAHCVKEEQFSHVLKNAHKRLVDKWLQLDPFYEIITTSSFEETLGLIEKIDSIDKQDCKKYSTNTQNFPAVNGHRYLFAEENLNEFLQEFAKYEARILDAQSHAQSARTAIDYAKRDLDSFDTKKAVLEKEIQELMEVERKEQAINVAKLDAFSPITTQIDLTKEALRVIPEKLHRTLATFESWKRQVDAIGIRYLDAHLDGEEHAQQRLQELQEQNKSFQLLNDGEEKRIYLHTSDIVKTMIGFRPQITESAQKIVDETEVVKNIDQKIERLDEQITNISTVIDKDMHSSSPDLIQSSNVLKEELTHTEQAKGREVNAPSLKENLDLKSRALQKLQTINELRSQGIKDFNAISQETKEAQENLAEKKTSAFVLLPGIFCLLLGAPLLILRLLSGENFIIFDKVQNLISFASLFPAWTGTLYVPLWLPSILIVIALISLYLPLSRKSDLELDQNRFNVLQKKLMATLENLDALRKDEMSILSCAFDIKEVKQGRLFEAVRSSYEEEDELVALYEKENLSYRNYVEENLAENIQSQKNQILSMSLEKSGAVTQTETLAIDLNTSNEKEVGTQLHAKQNVSAKNSSVQNIAKASEKVSALFIKVQKKVQRLLKEHDGQKKQEPRTTVPLMSVNTDNLSLGDDTGLSLNSLDITSTTQIGVTTKNEQNTAIEQTSIASVTPLAVEILEDQKKYNPQNIYKILEENLIYREVAKFVHEELQMLWEKEYAFLIAEEQRNDIKAQNHAKKLELLKEKSILEEKLAVSKTAVATFLEEWHMFFDQHYFTLIPEAQFIEAFFFRIAAAEALQKRLQELNMEVHTYNEHILSLRETVEKEYGDIIEELKNIAQANISNQQEVDKATNPQRALTNITTQDMLLALEKHIQNKRVALLNNKDISMREVALDDVLQAQNKSREHLESVQQNLVERQAVVDEEFMDCVNFLYGTSLLSAEFVKECQGISSASQLALEFDKTIHDADIPLTDTTHREPNYEANPLNGKKQNEQDAVDNGIADHAFSERKKKNQVIEVASASSKKLFLANVKQVVEIMFRYLESMSEYMNINQEKAHTQECIDTFDTTLHSLMEKAEFTPVYSTNVDYIEAFEQLFVRLEQERAKRKEVLRIQENIENIQYDMQGLQEDLNEIRSNLDELLKLAQVPNERALRDLIESQKEREQLVRSSLDLEEAFRTVPLPKYVKRAEKALQRAFDVSTLSSLQNDTQAYTDFPEIFAFFDESAQQIWQKQLETITDDYERIESQEQEIQSTCGALQAKCDALIESVSLVSLKRVQVNIEEEIKETYEKWRELSLSKEIITKAQAQYEQERQPHVISMASEFFATITDNVWKKIVVSLDNKEIKVMDEKGSLVNPELLSQGAKEQLYLSLRLAHIKSRAQTNQTVPILMDDILVNFDAKRAENTIKTLNKLLTEIPNASRFEEKEEVNINPSKGKARTSKKANILEKTDKIDTTVLDKNAGQQILFYTCHEHTARLIEDTIQNTKIYLVENKMVRPA